MNLIKNLLLAFLLILPYQSLYPQKTLPVDTKQNPVSAKEAKKIKLKKINFPGLKLRETGQPSMSLAKPQAGKKKETQLKTYPNDPINVKQYTLKNGLTVMLSENHDVPQVFGMVVVKAGGKNDPADATGLAHYLEHMLFKGTTTMGTINYEKEKPYLDKINDLYEELGKTSDEKERKKIQEKINDQSLLAGEYAIANEIDKLLSVIGGTGVNAFTTEEYTGYMNRFPSNQIDKWLEIYSHRFEKPVFRLFQSELETVYEEKNMEMDNTFFQLFETFLKNFYKKHPYGQQSIIGKTEHLKNPPLKKMYSYFNTYYVANNMALFLSGDFNSEEIIKLIEEKFGDWRTGKIPEYPKFIEKSFNARELVEVKMTPIKMGFIGFRVPGNGHDDNVILEVCNNILSNEEACGMLDKLVIDNKIMFASLFPFNLNDYGSTILLFAPKLIGQSLDKAEELILSRIKMVQNGEFDNRFFEAVKRNLIAKIAYKWESNGERVYEMADCFTQNRSWGEYVSLENKLKKVTKEDVIRVAKQYYGDNYICMTSKMGFPKKDKLTKPGFKPVIPKNEVKSEFYEKFQNIPSSKPNPKYVDFQNDINTLKLNEHVTLNLTNNPFNNIYSMEIEYGIGNYDLPKLLYVPSYLEMIGTNKYTANELIEEFYKLGSTYSFEVDEESFSIYLEGIEDKLPEVLKLISDFTINAKADEEKIKKLLQDIKAGNKVSRREPDFIADALQEYALYGKNSSFLRELTKKELKKLTGQELVENFNNAQNYEITINYIGKKATTDVKNILIDNFQFNQDLKPKTKPIVLDRIKKEETTVFTVKKKKTVQTQLYFHIEGKPMKLEDISQIDAFNEYFGANMSSLVFQEIREFRSLAYSAGAYYRLAMLQGKNNYFTGYIGCQGDKTMDALDAMITLIRNMPQKKERMESIKTAMIETAQSRRPSFRSLIEYVEICKEKGYTDDPNKIKIPKYHQLTFENILTFHENELKDKPMTITVVGNKKRFDFKELEKYGKVIKVKEKGLFVN
ncbi:MAG: insulinase family protein [Bacteroidota bacterium]